MVKKHSKNIIDLIEVGDYVNGYRVHQINCNTTLWTYVDGDIYKICDVEDIKSIVTKEQFEAMVYRVEA